MDLESKTNKEKAKLHCGKFAGGLVIGGIVGATVSQLLYPENNITVYSNIFGSLMIGSAYFPLVDKYIYQVKESWKEIYEYTPARTVGLFVGFEGARLFL